MHNRTGLILLTRIVSHFPTKSTLGEKILLTLTPLQEDSNPMQDIRAMAQSYSSQIIKARNDGVWKEESKKAAKARVALEKKKQEEREKDAAKRDEEMEKDSRAIARQLNEAPRDRRGRNMPPQQPRVGDRIQQSHPRDRDPRSGRGDMRPNQPHQGPPPHQGIQGRWSRDNVDSQRPADANRRRDEPNDLNRRRDRDDNRNQAGDNDSGKTLLGRWDPNNAGNGSENGRKPKRDRSPDNRGQDRGADRGTDRGQDRGKQGRGISMERDPKRTRRDASPHRSRRIGRRN